MNTRIAVLLVISLGFAAAAAASTVKYDFDRDVDFSKWTTMAWSSPAGPALSMTETRIAKAVEMGFQNRGYTRVESPAQADFVIDWRAAAWQDVRLDDTFRGPAFGRTLSVRREARGALVIDVHDARTGRLVWHGVVTDALAGDPEQADRKTAKAVEKLLKKFPMRGGGQ